MKLPRDLSGRALVAVLTSRFGYYVVHRRGSKSAAPARAVTRHDAPGLRCHAPTEDAADSARRAATEDLTLPQATEGAGSTRYASRRRYLAVSMLGPVNDNPSVRTTDGQLGESLPQLA